MRAKFSAVVIGLIFFFSFAEADTIPSGFSRPLQWRIGVEVSPAWVPGTNVFLRGGNPEGRRINSAMSGDIRADFSFSPSSREGKLYKDLYQGVGLGVSSFFAPALLGTPVSAYVYQGAPIFNFTSRLSLGYEWQFGASFGWKHFDEQTAENNAVVSTSVTAHMGLALKLNYRLSPRWHMSVGVGANHYSNGNTSWPNAGVNSIGLSLGVTYTLTRACEKYIPDFILEREADRHGWFYDITLFGATRKRIVAVGNPPEAELCPGSFGVVGIQLAPMYRLNRWCAVGPSLDMQWDEGAGLEPYWIQGSYGENIKFVRPPFDKQLNVGLSAHAELTMPIFSVNVGLGFDALCPHGEEPFYQSLTLKTFLTHRLYINTGYRLANFKTPQNLMLGIGVRL